MKLQIRNKCFETNSSSQHTLTIMDETEYEQYLNNSCDSSMYWDRHGERYVDRDEVVRRFDVMLKYGRIYGDTLKFHDDDKLNWMIDHHYYYRDDEDCSETIVEEINTGDGAKKYAVSRYTWDD